MRYSGPPVTGTVNGIDFDARYTVTGQSGVAWWLHGWATRDIPESWTLDCPAENMPGWDHDHDDSCYLCNEPEIVPDTDRVRAIMVGDDREFTFDVSDLTVIPDDGYCRDCGQTGCASNVYE
jgi:hypothetical protein